MREAFERFRFINRIVRRSILWAKYEMVSVFC